MHQRPVRERAGFSLAERDPRLEALLADVVDSIARVRTILGAGLYERVYERALSVELSTRGHVVDVQVPQRVTYEGIDLGIAYRADLMVDGRVLIELKAIEALLPRHSAQVLTYLRSSGLEAAILVNFNAVPLGEGIRRFLSTKAGANVGSL